MANWLEDLTQTLADDKLPRRQAIRRIAGSVTGIALASWLPGQVLAQNIPWKKQCPIGSDCPSCCENSNGNPNTNCFCFTSIEGKGACGCTNFCSQLPVCSHSSQCKRGFVCITENGCDGCGNSYGVCVAKCKGKHENCKLPDGHGLTVTGRVV